MFRSPVSAFPCCTTALFPAVSIVNWCRPLVAESTSNFPAISEPPLSTMSAQPNITTSLGQDVARAGAAMLT